MIVRNYWLLRMGAAQMKGQLMTTALVAGATGMLGSRIAHFLVAQPDVTVRLLARTGWDSDPAKRERIEPLLQAGAAVAVGAVSEPASLGEATKGVDVVISALQGQRDIIVVGQIALAAAAVRSGVRRFIPSDFAIDLFKAPAGAPQFEARKDADREIEAMDLQVVHVLSGAFMDGMFGPDSPGPVDLDEGTVTYWGTGYEPFDLITVDGTARFTARLAVDPDVQPGVHTISAGPTTYKNITRTIERATGKTLTPKILGGEQQLRDVIAAKADPWDAVYEWYALGMLKAPTFASTENSRYEDAQPTLVEDYLTAAYENAVVR
jgi:uncharacterized protein YbjT (DUF2867 family)